MRPLHVPLQAGMSAAVLVLVLLGTKIPGQAPSYDTQVRELDRGLKEKDLSKRIDAIRSFERCGEPAAVKVLLDRIFKSEKQLEKERERFEKVGRSLNEERAKITNVQLTQNEFDKAQEKIQPLEQEHARLAELIADEEEVIDRLAEASAFVVESLAGDERQKAVRHLVDAVPSARTENRPTLLLILGRVKDPLVTDALVGAAKLSPQAICRVAALEALLRHADPSTAPVAVDALQDDSWTVKSAALALLRATGGKDAIDPLIQALEREDGRLVDEVIATLRHLTKVDFHDNATLWRDWWAKNAESFTGHGAEAGAAAGDSAGGSPADPAATQDRGNYFYGIRTRSKNLIYVLDISGSMRWTLAETYREGRGPIPPDAPSGKSKLDSALKELLTSVGTLEEDATFNIIFYNIDVFVWKKDMQKATSANKAAVRKWAESLKADGATNIFDALERAFGIVGRASFDRNYKLAADTIFFLSDGEANRGRVVDRAQMLREIRALNALKRVQIHCVGLGLSIDEPFMSSLASENGGQFVHVRP